MPAGLKFEFPENIDLLAKHYKKESPAHMVRASMSIPLFFEPHRMELNPETWEKRVEIAYDKVLDEESLQKVKDLKEISFLDGGIFSNLPADAFEKSIPKLPTIVVPLVNKSAGSNFIKSSSLKGVINDAAILFDAVRLQRDRENLERFNIDAENFNGPANKVLLAPVNTGEANWLNFTMDEIEKQDLVLAGLEHARDFLKTELKLGV